MKKFVKVKSREDITKINDALRTNKISIIAWNSGGKMDYLYNSVQEISAENVNCYYVTDKTSGQTWTLMKQWCETSHPKLISRKGKL